MTEDNAARIYGKQSTTVKCKVCNARMASLHRIYGGWPPEGWKEDFAEEERKAFFSDVGKCESSTAIKRFTEAT